MFEEVFELVEGSSGMPTGVTFADAMSMPVEIRRWWLERRRSRGEARDAPVGPRMMTKK